MLTNQLILPSQKKQTKKKLKSLPPPSVFWGCVIFKFFVFLTVVWFLPNTRQRLRYMLNICLLSITCWSVGRVRMICRFNNDVDQSVGQSLLVSLIPHNFHKSSWISRLSGQIYIQLQKQHSNAMFTMLLHFFPHCICVDLYIHSYGDIFFSPNIVFSVSSLIETDRTTTGGFYYHSWPRL